MVEFVLAGSSWLNQKGENNFMTKVSHVSFVMSFVFLLFVGVQQAHAAPGLSISVPIPLAVNFSKATGLATPANSASVTINVAVAGVACTVTPYSMTLGKLNDKNSTTYDKNTGKMTGCSGSGSNFLGAITASPLDVIPATLGVDLAGFCLRSSRGGAYNAPMKAVFYYGPVATGAKYSADVSFPMKVTCGP